MPIRAAVLRGLITLCPLGASFAAATVVARSLGAPQGLANHILWWAAVLGSSGLTIVIGERLTRRLLPLQTLLKLSMAFPERAPKRFKVARQAGNVEALKRQFAKMARTTGGDPNAAAEMVLSLVTALSSHDRRTRGHSERVRVYADLLADSLGLPAPAKDRLRWAALLHDIGKLDVAAEILNKPGKPDEDEWAKLQRHPEWGARFIEPLRAWLGEWAPAVEHHHEKYDGSGYPGGLAGETISLGGRIVSVADAFEVMTTARPYKKPMRVSAAREELVRCAGTHFDPGVVRAFLNISIKRIRWAAGVLPSLFQIPVLGGLSPAVPRTVIGALAIAGGSIFSNPAPVPDSAPPARTIAAPPIGGSVAFRGPSVGNGSPSEDTASSPETVTEPITLDEPGTSATTPPLARKPRSGRDPRPDPKPSSSSPPSPAPVPVSDPDPAVEPSPTPTGPSNSAPTAMNDSASTPEDTASAITVTSNDSDPDGNLDPSTVAVIAAPSSGTAVKTGIGKITYTPALNFNGNDSFTYKVCDTVAVCDTATVSMTVVSVPDAPTASNDSASAVTVLPVSVPVFANDTDPDNDLVLSSVAIVSAPSNGTAVANNNGSITYTANLLFTGTDTLTYKICDSTALCAQAQLTISVVP